MKKNRLFSLLLAVLMTSPLFAACSETASEVTESSPADTAESIESVPESEAETTILDTIPENNLDGRTIKAITRKSIWWQLSDLDTESLNGEIVNDAIFNRNADLEERLNISFEVLQDFADYNELANEIRTILTAADDEFDIMIPFMNQAAQFAQEDYFVNLKSIDSIDLSNPAWDQNANSYFDIEGKLFFGISDISLAKNEATWTYMFNKRIANDYSLENMYDLVREGKWTYDKSVELMNTVTNDADGNGVMDTNDMYGLATHDVNYYALLISAGEPMAGKDENGKVIITAGSERFINVYDRICELFSGEKHTTLVDNMGMFMGGKALLCGQVMGCVRQFREMDDDFGLIPLPKYDEIQENYYAYVIPYDIAASVVPVTAKDPEISGTVLQTLAVLSSYYMTPAYYDITITGKGLCDEESAQMLDIIRASTTYDLARMFDWGGIASSTNTFLRQETPFASYFKRMQKMANIALEKTLNNFANAQS